MLRRNEGERRRDKALEAGTLAEREFLIREQSGTEQVEEPIK